LAKGKDGIVDLDAPVIALAGFPTGNKAAKAAALEGALTEKISLSINKCIADVSSNIIIRNKKANERWATLL
jgi:hypothetical protein